MDTIKLYLKLFLAVALSGLIWTSCIDDIVMDSGEDLPIVVECVLEKTPTQTLKLYKMKGLYQDETTPVENASISLIKFKSTIQEVVATFQREDSDTWTADYEPDFDASYRLSIVVNGTDTLWAETQFPKDLKLVSMLKYIREGSEGYPTSTDSVQFACKTCEVHLGSYTSGFEGSGNKWYLAYGPYAHGDLFKAYRTRYDGACKIWVYPHMDVTHSGTGMLHYMLEETYTFKGTDQPYTSYAVTDHPGADNFNIVPGRLSDLDICKMSKRDSSMLSFSSGAFLYPYDLFFQFCSFMCPDLALHDHFIRIDHPANFTNGLAKSELKNSYQFSQHSFLIAADYADSYPLYNYSFYHYTPSLTDGFVNEVRFLSDEYDAYLRDVVAKGLSSDNFVLSEYEHRNIYSNINGGFGIFGAQLVTWEEKYLTD